MKPRVSEISKKFKNFPAAKGGFQEVINSFKIGKLNEKDCAQWLLELSTEQKGLGIYTAVTHSNNRNSAPYAPAVEHNRFRGVYQWMVSIREIKADTAWQYTRRLQYLDEKGFLGNGARDLHTIITEAKDEWPNARQCLAALSLLIQFEEGNNAV